MESFSFYVHDIEGACAGTRRPIKPRKPIHTTNPANPVYQPFDRPTMAASERAALRASLRAVALERGPQHPAARSEIGEVIRASQADANRPIVVRERRHFRKTNYVADIEGTQVRTGARMAEGVLSRRQLNPMEPHYDWPQTVSRDVADAIEADDRPKQSAQRGTVRREALEAHLGPGMTLVVSRSRDLVRPQVQRAMQREVHKVDRGLSRSEAFAQQMATARSFFHEPVTTAANATAHARPGSLTPDARDPARMIDRSLTNADVPGAMAHRAHQIAAGHTVRVRREIRNPMVLMDEALAHFAEGGQPSIVHQSGQQAAAQLKHGTIGINTAPWRRPSVER